MTTVSNEQNQDPFAAASQSAKPADDGDPFATPDQIGGGGRFPNMADLLDRIVIMVPTSGVEQEPKYKGKPGETQDRITADLTVVDEGTVTVVVPETGEVIEFQTPYTWNNFYVRGLGVLPKLRNLPPGKQFLGVVKRCPTGAGYKKGETHETIAQRWDAWERAGRRGPDVEFSWGLIDPTPEQRQLAIAWYRAQR